MKADYQILIVDDDESIRRMLAAVLARDGFQTSTAGSGEEGLAVFRAQSPDIVLMDIRMPGLSGIEAMSAMLELRPGATVHIPHVNSDARPGGPEAVSDHDPVLATLPALANA